MLTLLLIASVMLMASQAISPVAAQTTTPCQLAPVFAMFRDTVGRDRVGECTAQAIRTDNDDVTQVTTRGALTLRAFDNVPMFNDGQMTWLYGPRGIESRTSSTRLPWETPLSAGTNQPGDPTGVLRGPAPINVAASPTPTLLPTPTPVDQTVKLEGSSSATTDPFDLTGGEYNVHWTARMQGGNSTCYVGSWIRRDGDPNPGNLLLHTNLNNTKDRSADGETRLFNVAPGRYVLDVMTTGCDWSYEIVTRH
jgi:hypothetical protein